MSDADNSDPKPKKRAAAKKTAKVEAPVDDWTPSAPSVRAVSKPESYDGVPNGQNDAQGRKDGLWVFREANGAVAEEHYREGFLHGKVRRFKPDGLLEREWELVPDPETKSLGPTGGWVTRALTTGATKQTVLNSQFTGTERIYHPNGGLSFEREYDSDGLLHGTARQWDADGALLDESGYAHGLRHGAQRTRKPDGTYEVKRFENGVPEIEAKTIKSLVTKLKKTKDDEYKVSTAFGTVAPYETHGALAWSMVRSKQWNPVECGWGSVMFLRSRVARTHRESVMELLLAIPGALDTKSMPLLEGWPYPLDEMVGHTFHPDDDAEWAALAAKLPEPLAIGVNFVRGRMGGKPSAEENARVLERLGNDIGAAAMVATYFVPMRDANGYVDRNVKPNTPERLEQLAARFGDAASFDRAVIAGAMAKPQLHSFYVPFVFARANTEQLADLVAKTTGNVASDVMFLLKGLPERPLAEWIAIADRAAPAPTTDYNRKRVADALFAMAALAAKREGVELPASLDRLVTLDAVEWSAGSSEPYKGWSLLREMLATLPKERVHTMAKTVLEQPYGFERAAAFLSVAPDAAMIDRLVERIGDITKSTTDKNSFRHSAFVAGTIGEAGLDAMRRAYESAEAGSARRALFYRVLVSTMGNAARDGAKLDASYAKYIDVVAPNGEKPEKYDFEWLLVPAFANALTALPESAREAAIVRNLDPNASMWTAGLTLAAIAPTEAVLARAGEVASVRGESLDGSDAFFSSMLRRLGDAKVDVLAKLLANAGDARANMRKALGQMLQHGELQKLDATTPAPKVEEKPLSDVERIEKLAAKFDEEKVSIYLLEREDGEAEANQPGRSGGTPLGVSDEEWPRHRDQPMEHVITLDLEAMPDLRERRNLGAYRALSLFVPDRDGGEALEKGKVLLLTAEQVARGELHKGREGEKSRRIKVTRVMVPRTVFFDPKGWNLEGVAEGNMRALRKALYQSQGRVLGLPYWLQSDPDEYGRGGPAGDFVMQFDDRLADINTGDSGLIYVFTGGVMMQCH